MGPSTRLVTRSLAGGLVSASDKRGTSTKIRIDNLYYEVTPQDLQQLFVSVGPVVRVDLIYDKSGRPSGSATVVFQHAVDAVRAVEKYHGVPLDGQELSIMVIPTKGERVKNNVFDRLGKRSADVSEMVVSMGRRGRVNKDANELERELDAYMETD
jgi:THO complex subunit 4